MTTPAIKTRESDEPVCGLSGEFCGICRRQISRYTCPSCNLFYCSLNCFRSESHSRCSEMFYRKEIEICIKSESSKTEEDRNKTIELLKRIEDQSAEDEDRLSRHSDEENEEDTLAHRLSEIDISSASADDLLRLLTKQERDKFFGALKDPSSGLAQELLQSTELQKIRKLPWWEAIIDGDRPSPSARVAYGVKPDLMVVPTNLVNQTSRGILLYNICELFLAYAYVTRHLSISPLATTANDSQDQNEARQILSQYVPFLVDHKSTLRHVCLTDAVISFWSRADPGSIHNKSMCLLLEDVEKLVRPRRVTIAEDPLGEQGRKTNLPADHPFATTIMAISDVCSLLNSGVSPSTIARHQNSRIAMKLTFYAAHILATPASHLHALADEVGQFSKSLGQEAR